MALDAKVVKDEVERQEHVVREDGLVMTVVGGRTFMRNAKRIKVSDGSEVSHTRVLVGELNGVRTYIMEDNKLIMTTEDLYF